LGAQLRAQLHGATVNVSARPQPKASFETAKAPRAACSRTRLALMIRMLLVKFKPSKPTVVEGMVAAHG